MAGKRVAHSRITKDQPEGESSDEGGVESSKRMQNIEGERKYPHPRVYNDPKP